MKESMALAAHPHGSNLLPHALLRSRVYNHAFLEGNPLQYLGKGIVLVLAEVSGTAHTIAVVCKPVYP